MRHTHENTAQHSRRNARGVRRLQAVVTVAHMDAAFQLGTLSTKQINPCWASGGLPMEGDS